jgi:DivIVA domain-containing protein
MQNLTPLEIQKQTFSRGLKGYNPDDVRAYLHLVAEEIERLLRENDRLSRDAAMLREDIEDHTNRERILKDTLLSAQKVAEDLTANARNGPGAFHRRSAHGAPRRPEQAHHDHRPDPAAHRARRRGRGERGADHVDVPPEKLVLSDIPVSPPLSRRLRSRRSCRSMNRNSSRCF